jgi:glycyl-tRNA synthetase beta chain
MLGRFRAHYQEQNIKVEMIRAVEVKRPTSALDFERRLKAVVNFAKLDTAVALAAANKRVNNILSKNGQSEFVEIDDALLTDAAEINLVNKLKAISGSVNTSFDAGDYQAGLNQLADVRDVIDSFFDDVMVMADDNAVKNNRLAILGELQRLFMFTADISVL